MRSDEGNEEGRPKGKAERVYITPKRLRDQEPGAYIVIYVSKLGVVHTLYFDSLIIEDGIVKFCRGPGKRGVLACPVDASWECFGVESLNFDMKDEINEQKAMMHIEEEMDVMKITKRVKELTPVELVEWRKQAIQVPARIETTLGYS